MKKYFFALLIGLILTSCQEKTMQLQRIEGTQIPVNKNNELDAEITKTITPYKGFLEAEMNEVLAYAPEDFYKGRNKDKAETSIGNFMADLCYTQGNPVFKKQSGKNIDFVLLNFGGIRAGIPKGDITVRSAYEVMPFENSMVVVELSYEKLQNLFKYLGKSSKAHPISRQLQIRFTNGEVTKSTIHGKELDPKKTYFVLTSDYLQHGGDRMNFFKNPIKLYNLEYKIRTAIINELKSIDSITAKEDGRMVRIMN